MGWVLSKSCRIQIKQENDKEGSEIILTVDFKDSLVIFGSYTQSSPVATDTLLSVVWKQHCCLVVMSTPCCGGPRAIWLWERCFRRQETSACSEAEDVIQYDSVAPCHWTQVVAVTEDNYRCFKFVSVLFPELCVLAHFKRSKQPTISMLISKQQ